MIKVNYMNSAHDSQTTIKKKWMKYLLINKLNLFTFLIETETLTLTNFFISVKNFTLDYLIK
jgi:hypothetical protein